MTCCAHVTRTCLLFSSHPDDACWQQQMMTTRLYRKIPVRPDIGDRQKVGSSWFDRHRAPVTAGAGEWGG